jgi:glucose-6-phosphate 1-dehydrogenase
VQNYKAGNSGPDDALGLILKDGRKWQNFES